jgi:hypothetical protein
MAAFAPYTDIIDTEKKGKSRTEKAAAAAEAEASGSECVKRARCYLRPYEPGEEEDGCCPGQTGHHIPPKACFKTSAGTYSGKYDPKTALCACMEGMNQHCGSHGKNHAAIEWLAEQKNIKPNQPCSVAEYNELCAATMEAQCGCKKDCIEDQLNQQAKKVKVDKVKHKDTNSSSGVSEELKAQVRKSAGLQSASAKSK